MGEVVEVGRVRFFRVGVFLLAIILIVSATVEVRRHSRDQAGTPVDEARFVARSQTPP
jgi:hypothetical protein